MLIEVDNIESERFSSYQFTEEDHQMLRSYYGAIDSIANFFGKQCEVILKSLENMDRSVMKVCRGFNTGHVKFSPINDFILNILQDMSAQKKLYSKASFTQTKDGDMLSSMTIAIKNRTEITIGLIYINTNLSAFFIDFVQELLLKLENKDVEPAVNFAVTVKELVSHSVEKTIIEVNNRIDITNNAKNKHIVISLYQQGIFDIKNAINMVADKLNISQHTVYLYIRQVKLDEVEL